MLTIVEPRFLARDAQKTQTSFQSLRKDSTHHPKMRLRGGLSFVTADVPRPRRRSSSQHGSDPIHSGATQLTLKFMLNNRPRHDPLCEEQALQPVPEK